MFRLVLLIVGIVLLGLGLLAVAEVGWPAAGAVVVPAVLVLSLLFERYVYKPIRRDPPEPGWEKTAERFADPGSGQVVTVYSNRTTGERRYVAEPDA